MKRRYPPLRQEIAASFGRALVWLATLGLAVVTCLLLQTIVARIQTMGQPVDPSAMMLSNHSGPGVAPRLPDFGDPPWPDYPAPLNPVTKTKLTYEEMFREIASQYNLDWRLLAELAYQESRLNPLAMGKDNDMGLMQIIPSTWNEWAPQLGVTDPFDPYSNVLVGAAYLAYVRDFAMTRGHSEPHWMLIGYNWGPDNLGKLFAGNGDWAQVPARPRDYAVQILQAVSTKSNRWQIQSTAEAPISSASLAPLADGRLD